MGVTKELIVELHPVLYHMAEPGIWDSVKNHGLLSTSALLDLHGVKGEERVRIEEQRRPKPCPVKGDGLERATIRDNRPISDGKLRTCLPDGMDPTEWYKLLNGKVFFWLTEARLITLMNAYSDQSHLVLEVETKELLQRHLGRVKLTPLNTGCTSPMAFPRGPHSFFPLQDYDFEGNKKKKGGPKKAIVELTVDYAVADISEFVIRARHAHVADNKLVTEDVLYAR